LLVQSISDEVKNVTKNQVTFEVITIVKTSCIESNKVKIKRLIHFEQTTITYANIYDRENEEQYICLLLYTLYLIICIDYSISLLVYFL